jgi:dihydroxyacetone kinase-like predicted kinase
MLIPDATFATAPIPTTADAGNTHMSTGITEHERPALMSAGRARRYRVEYLIVEPFRPADALQRELAARLGDEPHGGAIAVAGDESLIKVHLTTAQPEIALAVGRSAGALADVIVEPRCIGASWERAA